jgi:hypothetical protein
MMSVNGTPVSTHALLLYGNYDSETLYVDVPERKRVITSGGEDTIKLSHCHVSQFEEENRVVPQLENLDPKYGVRSPDLQSLQQSGRPSSRYDN